MISVASAVTYAVPRTVGRMTPSTTSTEPSRTVPIMLSHITLVAEAGDILKRDVAGRVQLRGNDADRGFRSGVIRVP